MRQKRNRQRTIFEVLGKNPGPKEFEQMALVLESNPEILDLAFSDLTKGRRADTGREGMTAEQVLRCAIVKQSRELTYNDLEFLLADSYSLRSFTKLRQDQFPSTSTLQSNIKSLREETWIAIHQFIISYANEEKLEKGRKLRLDSTVVETDIHAPSDSTLLWDGVRVIARWLFEGKEFSPQPVYRFSDHRRVMKKRLLKIQNTRSKTVRESAYRNMLECAYRVCTYGKEAAEELYDYKGGKDAFDMFRARAYSYIQRFVLDRIRKTRGAARCSDNVYTRMSPGEISEGSFQYRVVKVVGHPNPYAPGQLCFKQRSCAIEFKKNFLCCREQFLTGIS